MQPAVVVRIHQKTNTLEFLSKGSTLCRLGFLFIRVIGPAYQRQVFSSYHDELLFVREHNVIEEVL